MVQAGFSEPSAVYTSATQQARHLTEGWMAEHGFCPACPADRLPPLSNNTRVGEFRCADCGDGLELKDATASLAQFTVLFGLDTSARALTLG